jgi:hypothetical protein
MPVRQVPRDPGDSSQELLRQPVEARLDTLRAEYEKGQAQLNQLQGQLGSLRETMLRISGAIAVLEEILSSSTPSASLDRPPPPEPALNAGASAPDE